MTLGHLVSDFKVLLFFYRFFILNSLQNVANKKILDTEINQNQRLFNSMNSCIIRAAIQMEAVELYKELYIFTIKYLFKLMFMTKNEKAMNVRTIKILNFICFLELLHSRLKRRMNM